MALNVYTNFDVAAPLPEAVTAALGGSGRYKGRFYILARDKDEVLPVLARYGLLLHVHHRSVQPVPKAQRLRASGLRDAGVLIASGDVALVVTHDPEGTRISQPPVLVRDDGQWSWIGRIRNGGRWADLTPEDTWHHLT